MPIRIPKTASRKPRETTSRRTDAAPSAPKAIQNPDLPGPLADVIADYAVDADRCECERNQSKKCKQTRVKAPLSNRAVETLLHRLHIKGSLAGIDRKERSLERRNHFPRCHSGAHDDGLGRPRPLPIREIHFCHRLPIQSGVMDGTNHANDLGSLFGLKSARKPQTLPDWIFVREKLTDEFLIHHHHWRPIRGIPCGGKYAARNKRDPERAKVSAGNDPKFGQRTLLRRLRPPIDIERHRCARGIEGKKVDRPQPPARPATPRFAPALDRKMPHFLRAVSTGARA